MPALLGSIQDKLNKLAPIAKKAALGDVLAELIAGFNALSVRCDSALLSSAAIAIKAASSAVVRTTAAFSATINGAMVLRAANLDLPALVGNIAAGRTAAWAFYVDAAGAFSISAKTADALTAAAAAALLPPVPDGRAMIGFITVANATGANFVGGTTALDAANITTTYYNTPGPVVLAPSVAATAIASVENRG